MICGSAGCTHYCILNCYNGCAYTCKNYACGVDCAVDCSDGCETDSMCDNESGGGCQSSSCADGCDSFCTADCSFIYCRSNCNYANKADGEKHQGCDRCNKTCGNWSCNWIAWDNDAFGGFDGRSGGNLYCNNCDSDCGTGGLS